MEAYQYSLFPNGYQQVLVGYLQPNYDWMTVSACALDKEPPPKQIKQAEPLVESVRVYLANEISSKQLALVSQTPKPQENLTPITCEVDIGSTVSPREEAKLDLSSENRNDLNNNSGLRQLSGQQNTDTVDGNMPSRSERMQRQPLLARNTKQSQPITSDSSDPDHDEQLASERLNGDFIVEIPPGTVREERYPKEVWKCVLSFIFLFVCVCINMTSLALVHDRLPNRNTTAPLNDAVLDSVKAWDEGLTISEWMIIISSTTAMIVVVFHKYRFIVSRRLFFIIGLLYLYRSITMFVTVMPVSSRTYYCSPQSTNATPVVIVKRIIYLISGFGLSINGKHTYCGDYIYSGHTMILVMSYLVITEYSPKKLWPMHWIAWALAFMGVTFVLLAHAHYTVDVVIAYYITTRTFWLFHSLLAMWPHRNGPSNHMIQREWWYFMFRYLEGNARGSVPRRYNWPLPWPRTKLFNRLS